MSTVAAPKPPVDARWGIVRRAAASATFERSPRQRELLLYVGECALENRTQDLHEQLIGTRVFGRRPDYSPAEDNIVRAEVRLLRKRLESYFNSEGCGEPLIIRIPKGSYVPVFEPREVHDLAVVTPARSWLGWQTAAIAALAVACLWMWGENRQSARRVPAAGSWASRSPLWTLLFSEGRQTSIVCADSALVVAQTLLHRSISLDEYLAHHYGRAGPLPAMLPRWHFTDITDVRLVERLHSLNAEHWDKVWIRLARTIQLQDFKDSNLILLGSTRSNPWGKLFEPLVNFSFDFDDRSRTPMIRNKKPLPGEPAVYRAAGPGESGEAYSTIALVPNLRHTGNVLLIGGTTGESTEATGEFIMNREASAALIDTLMKRNGGRLPYFDVLLRSGTFSGVAKNAEVLSIRILPGETARN